MTFSVKRFCPELGYDELVEYTVPDENMTLLEALNHVKTKVDATLSYSAGCRSGVCGSCAMRVNGSEELACSYKLSEGDRIEPLRNVPVVRDLIVDNEKMQRFNLLAKAWMTESDSNREVSVEDAEQNELQTDCILCGSCYSACPVYEVNGEFLGPFALTRVWRYVSDVREDDTAGKIAAVQQNGIWDCTLCNACVPVCPQGIAPKQDISMLRNKSGMMGYMDPNFANQSFGGGMDFSGGFGGTPWS